MTEEKKEDKGASEAATPQAAPAQPQASQAEAPKVETPKAEAPKEAAKVKKEKPSNCAACNKSIKNKRWYYRNGKFYCTKRCWKSTVKKETKPEEAANTSQ